MIPLPYSNPIMAITKFTHSNCHLASKHQKCITCNTDVWLITFLTIFHIAFIKPHVKLLCCSCLHRFNLYQLFVITESSCKNEKLHTSIDKFCCKQYNVNQFTTYEFNDNRNLHVTECSFKLINSITIYSVSINSITINSISINSIFNLKKFTSMVANDCKCLKHSQFDCSFQTMTIHFH